MRVVIVFIFSLLISFTGFAQPRSKKIEELKLAYISDRLNLGEEDDVRFRSVYRNYQQDINGLVRQKHLKRRGNVQGPEPFEDEITFESKMLNVKKHYRNEFLKFLPRQKVAQIFIAEREFREKLIQELRERRRY